MQIQISEKDIDKIFGEITAIKYGVNFGGFEPIINDLSALKQGGALTWAHLCRISDPAVWHFHKYWRWPPEAELAYSLERTKDIFRDINKDTEENAVIELTDIFKNMQLASIVLRFVYPEEYAIYSYPVAKVLNAPRGKNSIWEYLNYLEALREVRDIYKLKRTDYAEMFLWVLGESENKKLNAALRKLFDEDNAKRLANPGFVSKLVHEDDLGKAAMFYENEVYQTAAQLAGIYFTGFVKRESEKCGISLKSEDFRWKDTSKLIIELRKHPLSRCKDPSYELEKLNRKRNEYIKNEKQASKQDAEWMIKEAGKLKIL